MFAGAVGVHFINDHVLLQLFFLIGSGDGILKAAFKGFFGQADLMQDSLDDLFVHGLSVMGGAHNGQFLVGKAKELIRTGKQYVHGL